MDYLTQRHAQSPEKLQARKVTFERVVVDQILIKAWAALRDFPLTEVEVCSDKGIEDYQGPSLKVDFANEFIGGGVLQYGNVQEELMFTVNPELIAAMAFTEVMKSNEAVVIVGAERVSNYEGYGGRARYTGKYHDPRTDDSAEFLDSHVVAIDALMLMGCEQSQYTPMKIARELNKAYAGFIRRHCEGSGDLRPVVTGKWGCGMFCGDAQLKFLIQWAAASRAGRKIVFMTFGDPSLRLIEDVVQKFRGETLGGLVAEMEAVASTIPIFEALLRRS
jgi:poly(ADP-ribose) glycohydrolase